VIVPYQRSGRVERTVEKASALLGSNTGGHSGKCHFPGVARYHGRRDASLASPTHWENLGTMVMGYTPNTVPVFYGPADLRG